jgi:16S rRNA (uracil1498-N3)-methyltransferase
VTTEPSFEYAVKSAAKAELPLFLYEDEKKLGIREALEACPDAKTLSLMTGPEGGFEPVEAAFAIDNGMKSVTLGPRILRCETAPICALSVVMYATGNL